MILTALLFGAAVIAGVGLVALFWNDLVDFLKRAIKKVQQIVSGIVYGFKVFVKKTLEGFQEISKTYSKKQDTWEETTTTHTVDESEVPADIVAKAEAKKGQEVDMTDEVELQLQSSY